MPSELFAIDVPGVTGPTAPYPSAVRVGDCVFVSGQVSLDEAGAVVGPDDAYAQTRQCLRRLDSVLGHFGLGLENVASTTVYLTDSQLADAYNAAWADAFGSHRPARATVVCGLLDERFLVEVQAVAWFGER
ncbi:RidA family protein [Sinomonas sp. JGH33]|uniref:RidA family protein n=1 Tax=Sinomonas terricola TaxID=3110330 RepID=A0ABU5TAY2_9MICC|nr:RidA family protein [Sinomonas sp. JGH33]MEA5456843.1 RidA family protein [Sinomonas sp. JGH33]